MPRESTTEFATARLRRWHENRSQILEFGDCQLDLNSHKLFRNGVVIALMPKEYRLLEYFAHNIGRALTRDKILDDVWGEDLIVTQRSVDRCVNTLRNKIEPDPRQPQFIQTIRDAGYRFEAFQTGTPHPGSGMFRLFASIEQCDDNIRPRPGSWAQRRKAGSTFWDTISNGG